MAEWIRQNMPETYAGWLNLVGNWHRYWAIRHSAKLAHHLTMDKQFTLAFETIDIMKRINIPDRPGSPPRS